MSGTFNTTDLAGLRVLVTGDPGQQCILDGSTWAEVKHQLAHKTADEIFDAEVNAFFAPIAEAMAKAEGVIMNSIPKFDDASVIVLSEPVEGVAAQEGEAIVLDHDATVLRLIEEGRTDRLIWVGNDSIEIIAVKQATVAVSAEDIDVTFEPASAESVGNVDDLA